MMLSIRPRLAFSQKGRFLQLIPLLGVILTLGAEPAQAQRPLGTDVSHWQGTINWTTVKNAGVAFAWAKATESDYYTDAYFTANVNGAKSVGIPIGAYHFARPSSHPNITGPNSAETEAAHFWSVVGNYVKPGGIYMVPMLDWEDTYYTKAAGFTDANTASAWVNQWCNTVSNYARANGVIGMKPIVYTGVWYSQPSSTYPGLTTAVTIWPSWIAAYPSNPNPQTGGPSSSYPWSTWNVWQYADTNWSGGDSDVFNGTLAQMQATLVIGSGSSPSITSQPSDRFADLGGALTLRVAAGGVEPLKYQWRLNGADIAGATSNVYTMTNIQAASAGSYTVVVTNTLGRATSSVAKLTVNPPFATVFADNFDANSSANWRLNRSSASNTRLAFAYNYAGYGIPSAPHSTGGTTKGLKLEANYTGAGVAALNISPIGQSFGANYRLHFDMWINANGPFPLGGSGSSQFITAGVGTDGTRVEWNTGNSDGVWFAIDGEGQATDTSPDIRAQVGTTLQEPTTGVYVGGTSTSIRRCSDPYYSNVFPGGQTPPAAQGQTGALAVGTVGFAWHDVVVNKSGNVIEWYIDGLKYCSVTNSSLTANNVFVGYWDPFSSLSSNTNLSFGLVDNLRVEVPALAPTITSHPSPVAVPVTANATFTAAATGVPGPAYQWRFNGANIAGATGTSYTRMNVPYADAGTYSVLVTNVAGTNVSSGAALSILTASPGQFQPAAVQSDGSLQLVLSGDSGATYYVQSSTNLIDWQPFTNVTIVNGTSTFDAGYVTNGPALYFRARSGP